MLLPRVRLSARGARRWGGNPRLLRLVAARQLRVTARVRDEVRAVLDGPGDVRADAQAERGLLSEDRRVGPVADLASASDRDIVEQW